jgi:hypothetical protein
MEISILKTKIDHLIELIKNLKENKEYKDDPFKLEMYILYTYPELYDSQPFICKYLCKPNCNISIIYTMLNKLEDVENGIKTMEDTEKELSNDLANKFLLPFINK